MLDSFATLWTVACQALLSMGFSRQEYWSELLFPSPGHLPDPGIKPVLAGGFFFFFFLPLSHRGNPHESLFSHPVMSNSLWPHGPAHQASLSLTISWSFPKFMSIALVMQSSHLTLWYPLLLLLSLSQHQELFQWVRCSLRWSKYWSFSISPSNKYSELISLKLDWFDLLTIQGTLRCLFHHNSLKGSIFQCPAFFTIQL